MSRPVKCRRICHKPLFDCFMPTAYGGAECRDRIGDRRDNVIDILTVDEYETIRLLDLEKCSQEECAEMMDIARTTVTAVYESARSKIADSIVNGKTLKIEGGSYRLCEGTAEKCCRRFCRTRSAEYVKCMNIYGGEVLSSSDTDPVDGIKEDSADKKDKKDMNDKKDENDKEGENNMKVAVTYDNGEVFQHFGHTEQFKVYDIENGAIAKSEIIGSDGQGHGALAKLLQGDGIDVLICGGIGGGAQMALAEAGIKLYGGVSGSADEAVEAFIGNKLDFDPDVHCDHHEEGHSCGDHSCGGNHSCGN